MKQNQLQKSFSGNGQKLLLNNLLETVINIWEKYRENKTYAAEGG